MFLSVNLLITLSLIDDKTVNMIVTKFGIDLDGYLGNDMGQVLSALVHRGLPRETELSKGVDQREGEEAGILRSRVAG